MKITKIDWTEGKKYKCGAITYTVVKRYYGHDLLSENNVMITESKILDEILKLDFEEVIEPVDFLTAYKDCLENGNSYVRQGLEHCAMHRTFSKGTHIVRCENTKIGALVPLTGLWIKEE